MILHGILIHFPCQVGNERLSTNMGWIGMAFPHHLPQIMGVIDDHTGRQGILGEWLPGTNLPEELRGEHLLEAFLIDIVHSEVSENAGLNVPVGIDMEILPAPSETAINIGTIVPEIAEKQGFGRPDSP